MPIYEYQCKNCNEVFEVEHSRNQVINNFECPFCQKISEVEKLISLSSFTLSWAPPIKDGKRSPVKRIGNQLYDEDSYTKAKDRGRFRSRKRIKL